MQARVLIYFSLLLIPTLIIVSSKNNEYGKKITPSKFFSGKKESVS
jgi:hypothetical protein